MMHSQLEEQKAEIETLRRQLQQMQTTQSPEMLESRTQLETFLADPAPTSEFAPSVAQGMAPLQTMSETLLSSDIARSASGGSDSQLIEGLELSDADFLLSALGTDV